MSSPGGAAGSESVFGALRSTVVIAREEIDSTFITSSLIAVSSPSFGVPS